MPVPDRPVAALVEHVAEALWEHGQRWVPWSEALKAEGDDPRSLLALQAAACRAEAREMLTAAQQVVDETWARGNEIRSLNSLAYQPIGTPLWCADDQVREVMWSDGHPTLRSFDGQHVPAADVEELLPATIIRRPAHATATADQIEKIARLVFIAGGGDGRQWDTDPTHTYTKKRHRDRVEVALAAAQAFAPARAAADATRTPGRE